MPTEKQRAKWREEYQKRKEYEQKLARNRSRIKRAKEKKEREARAEKAGYIAHHKEKGEIKSEWSPKKNINTYEKWNAVRPNTYHKRNVIRVHKQHPNWSLSEINRHIRTSRKPGIGGGGIGGGEPKPIEGYRYDAKFSISYKSREPQQTRHGHLTGTVYSTTPLSTEAIFNKLLKDAQNHTTMTWLDGVGPNRNSNIYCNESKTMMTFNHVANVVVKNDVRF